MSGIFLKRPWNQLWNADPKMYVMSRMFNKILTNYLGNKTINFMAQIGPFTQKNGREKLN